MRRILFLFCIFCTVDLFALTISGNVLDKKTGKAVEGAAVAIEEINATTYTNEKGDFTFENISPGKYSLYVSHTAYGTNRIPVKVKRDFFLKLLLKKYPNSIDPVKKYYKPFEDRFGTQSITQQNIKDMPMRGIGDSLHLLQSLPGVGSAYSSSAVPIVRGGNPLLDRYYIDDLPVDYPYHNLWFGDVHVPLVASAFSEEIIDTATLIKGPYPMYFDDSIGGIINIKTKDPEKPGFHGKVFLDPIFPVLPTIHATLVPHKDLSITANVRRNYSDWLLETVKWDWMDINLFRDLFFQDYYVKVRYNLFSKHRLYFIAFGALDNMNYEAVKNINQFDTEALKWEFLINKKMFLKTMVSRHHVKQEKNVGKLYLKYNPIQYRIFQQFDLSFDNFYIKTGHEFTVDDGYVRSNTTLFGINTSSYIGYQLNNLILSSGGGTPLDIMLLYYLVEKGKIDMPSSKINTPIKGISYSLFSEAGFEYNIVWANVGLKYKYYGPLDNHSFSARAMAGVNVMNWLKIYAGGGYYNSHPDMKYYTGAINPSSSDNKAYNIIIGAKSNILSYKKLNLFGQAEFFYTGYEKLISKSGEIVYDGESRTNEQLHPYSVEDKGKSYGIELYIKGKFSKYLHGWISYTFQKSKRDSGKYSMYDYHSDFDQTHILRIALSANIWIVTPSLIWHCYTSLPYTPIVYSTPEYIPSSTTAYKYNPVYWRYNSARFPMHHRLDAKLTFNFKGGHRFYIEAWNIYNNQSNYVYEKFDSTKPNISSTVNKYYGFTVNPEKVNDVEKLTGFFLWIGMEVCF